MRVFRDGASWAQEYRRGVVQTPFRREADTSETGLEFSFRPRSNDIGLLDPLRYLLRLNVHQHDRDSKAAYEKLNGFLLEQVLSKAGIRTDYTRVPTAPRIRLCAVSDMFS